MFDFEFVTVEDIEDNLASELPDKPFSTLEPCLFPLSFDLYVSDWLVLPSKYVWLTEKPALDDYMDKFSV